MIYKNDKYQIQMPKSQLFEEGGISTGVSDITLIFCMFKQKFVMTI